jgi:hypothetical protein
VAAFDGRIEGCNGAYLENGNASEDLQGTVKGEGLWERLWELSEKLVEEKFE